MELYVEEELDMVNFGPRSTVPEAFRNRQLYQHNPSVTLMRTTPAENEEIGRRIASRLNQATGPVKVIVPRRGVSLYAKEGGPFFDPDADRRAIEALREDLDRSIELEELETDINDPEFARACAEHLLKMLRENDSSRRAPGTGKAEQQPAEDV